MPFNNGDPTVFGKELKVYSGEDKLAYYKARSELLDELLGCTMTIQKFRSGGFVNKDPDMTRISFEMPVNKAREILDRFK